MKTTVPSVCIKCGTTNQFIQVPIQTGNKDLMMNRLKTIMTRTINSGGQLSVKLPPVLIKEVIGGYIYKRQKVSECGAMLDNLRQRNKANEATIDAVAQSYPPLIAASRNLLKAVSDAVDPFDSVMPQVTQEFEILTTHADEVDNSLRNTYGDAYNNYRFFFNPETEDVTVRADTIKDGLLSEQVEKLIADPFFESPEWSADEISPELMLRIIEGYLFCSKKAGRRGTALQRLQDDRRSIIDEEGCMARIGIPLINAARDFAKAVTEAEDPEGGVVPQITEPLEVLLATADNAEELLRTNYGDSYAQLLDTEDYDFLDDYVRCGGTCCR